MRRQSGCPQSGLSLSKCCSAAPAEAVLQLEGKAAAGIDARTIPVPGGRGRVLLRLLLRRSIADLSRRARIQFLEKDHRRCPISVAQGPVLRQVDPAHFVVEIELLDGGASRVAPDQQLVTVAAFRPNPWARGLDGRHAAQ